MINTKMPEWTLKGFDEPGSPKPLTAGELIMPSALTRVFKYGDAYATVRLYQDCLALSDLFVMPHRRREGYGGLLMARVLAYADDLQMPVALYCAPSMGRNYLDDEALRAFYERRGFIDHPHFDLPDLLLRYPKES